MSGSLGEMEDPDELEGLWEQEAGPRDMPPLIFFVWAVRLSRGPDWEKEDKGAPLSIVAIDLRENAPLKKIVDFLPKRSVRECFSILMGEIDLVAPVRREMALAQLRSLSAQAQGDLKKGGKWTKKGRQLGLVSTVSIERDEWWASSEGRQFLLQGAAEGVPLVFADIGEKRHRATQMDPGWEPFERGADKDQETREWYETANKTAPILAQAMHRHANSVFGEGSVFFAKAGESHAGNYFDEIAAAFEARELAQEAAIGTTGNPRGGASALVDGVAVKRL